MINVSDSTKRAFMNDSGYKTLRLVFPELNVTLYNDSIVKGSMSLSESLNSGSSVEFVGCISSSLRIKVYNINQKLKGKRIELYIKSGNTEEIPLFKGIVDDAIIQAERAFKEITAYDNLYTIGQKEIASWYNNLSYPISLGDIRRSLCSYIGLTTENVTLPNDDIIVSEKKFNNVESLKALTVLKSICQANGVFGIINRYGVFVFRRPVAGYDRVFPGDDTFLGPDLFPVANGEPHGVGYQIYENYKSIRYDEYFVKPVERIQIRDGEEDTGIIFGPETGNKYIIQANMFLFEMDSSTKTQAASNIMSNIDNVSFHPCEIECLGLPFVEVGDVVTYPIGRHYGEEGNYDVNTFVVMSRTLKGEQLLFDTIISEGEEEQSEFITDVQAQLDSIKKNGVDMDEYVTQDYMTDYLDENYLDIPDTLGAIDNEIAMMEAPTGFEIVSCYNLPSNRKNNTLYIVGSTVVVL